MMHRRHYQHNHAINRLLRSPATAARGALGIAVTGVLLLLGGCADQTQPASGTAPGPPQPPVPPMLQPQQQAGQSDKSTTQQADTAKQTAAKERVKAEVGVGDKTRRLENPDLVKPIIEPARVFFRTRERIAFEIQIPHALQLYKALNGKGPATHEEFMEKIIKANNLKLPELRSGERYIYDPETEELMVERPASRR